MTSVLGPWLRIGAACAVSSILALGVATLGGAAAYSVPVERAAPGVVALLPTADPGTADAHRAAQPAPAESPATPATPGATAPGALPTAMELPAATPTAVGAAPGGAVATAAPSPTPAPPAPTPTKPSVAAALPDQVRLSGLRYERQSFNNCGPATVSMLVNFLGARTDQTQAAQVLRPDKDDRNVSPTELAAFARASGFRARAFVGGDLGMLRELVAAGVPVITEVWFIPQPNDEMGHYQLLTGYDPDALLFHDSYHGPNVRQSPAAFDALWRVFNRTFVLAWLPAQDALVQHALGDLANESAMYERALAAAREDVAHNAQDKFAWFNMGSSLVALGDAPAAASAYDTARKLGLPWRMLWYQFGPYEAYYASKRYGDVIALSNATLKPVSNLEESLYWRGLAERALGNTEASKRDLQEALRLNPNFAPARAALG